MSEAPSAASAAGEALSCPSARCEPGATLLGIVDRDGRVAPLRTPLVIDESFVKTAAAGRSPERRFRFANRCVESACRQWTGKGCGVIDRVIAVLEQEVKVSAEDTAGLRPCAIRATCRWFHQRRAAACAACTYVVTDQTC